VAARRVLVGVAACFAFGTSAALCAEVPIPASPTQWVTDKAGFLEAQTVEQLNARLRSYQHTTGHQVLVYIAPTTGQTPMEDWTVRAFHAWKVGRKGLDDGLILFIFSDDHRMRIEVGYGLESKVPDAVAARIIRDTITPDLHANRPDRAVTAGVDRILGTIGGEAPRPAESEEAAPQAEEAAPDSISLSALLAVFSGFFLFMMFMFVFFRFAVRRGSVHISGSSGGSSGHQSSSFSSGGSSDSSSSDDDDFSGGGGDSGGGGASGSW
jgi:uncharacterized protein